MTTKPISVGEVTPEAVRIVAAGLRPQDEVEVWMTTGKQPVVAIEQALKVSRVSYLGYIGDEPVAIFGLSHLNDEVGIPWMLGTPALSRSAHRWLRKAEEVVAWMHHSYPVLTNIVHKKNTAAIRWLKHLGFQFLDAEVPAHPDFIQFVRYA